MCKYEMDPTGIVEDTERTRFCPQTDRQTDGQGETSIPPFNFVEAVGIINIEKFMLKTKLSSVQNTGTWYPRPRPVFPTHQVSDKPALTVDYMPRYSARIMICITISLGKSTRLQFLYQRSN